MTTEQTAKSTLAIVRASLERNCGHVEPHLQAALTNIARNEALPRRLRIEASSLLAEANA